MSRRPWLVLTSMLAMSVVALGTAAAAIASPVTVGSPLTAAFAPRVCDSEHTCTGLMATLPEAGAVATSPVDGAVVRWRVLQGSPGRQFNLRVLTPKGGNAYTATATSAPGAPAGEGVETFPTALPIKAGQTVGIDIDPNAEIGFIKENGGALISWSPAIPEGPMPFPPEELNAEIGFNADVQPRPTVTGVSPAKGSFKGGASVKISGSDFAGVSAVTFGTTPAKSFTVDSEAQITAVAPPLPARASVAVSVTTIAGTATSAATFRAGACVVPNLKGKKKKAAGKKLKKAECKLGKVKGDHSLDSKITKQSPKAGKKLAPGSKVKVTLG